MTTMPSVLTETGFITNPDEEKFLNSKEGQDNIASSIFKACRDYITDIDSKSSKFPVKNQNQEPEPDQLCYNQLHNHGEIVFMVQIATSSSKIEIKPENFKGLKDVTEINAAGSVKICNRKFY